MFRKDERKFTCRSTLLTRKQRGKWTFLRVNWSLGLLHRELNWGNFGKFCFLLYENWKFFKNYFKVLNGTFEVANNYFNNKNFFSLFKKKINKFLVWENCKTINFSTTSLSNFYIWSKKLFRAFERSFSVKKKYLLSY